MIISDLISRKELTVIMEIKILENEYWYGGAAYRAARQPYDAHSEEIIEFRLDMAQKEDFDICCEQVSPLFLSSKGRCIYGRKLFRIEFKSGIIRITGEDVIFTDNHKTLKGAQLFAAKNYFSQNTDIPNESFFRFPQFNSWIELGQNQSQEGILKYAEGIVKNGFKPGVLMIDDGWDEYFGSFEFHSGKFSQPKEMVEKLHEMGFKVMLWVSPFITMDTPVFRELNKCGYLICTDGRPAAKAWWNGYSAMLDLTNPQAADYFADRLHYLMNTYGIDGFKFDAGGAGTYSINDDIYKKLPAIEQTKIYDEFGLNFEFHELRPAYNMAGTPLVSRLQDKVCQWTKKGIQGLIPESLIQGLVGYFFGCPDMVGGGDIGSFINDTTDNELFVRWTQASALCPMIQFSAAPWRVLTEESFRAVKKVLDIREKYTDLILALAKNAAETGEPVMRMMEYEFPEQGFERVMDQFMLGSSIMAAPITEQGMTSREVKIPEGRWKCSDGKEYNGGKSYNISCPLDELLIFEKI